MCYFIASNLVFCFVLGLVWFFFLLGFFFAWIFIPVSVYLFIYYFPLNVLYLLELDCNDLVISYSCRFWCCLFFFFFFFNSNKTFIVKPFFSRHLFLWNQLFWRIIGTLFCHIYRFLPRKIKRKKKTTNFLFLRFLISLHIFF